MDIFFWRKNKQIDLFASATANDFFSRVQPEVAQEYFEKKSGKADKSAKTMERTIRDITGKVQQFRKANSLGVYGKARFHLNFTERLKELGYDNDLAKKVNEIILLKTP